MDSDIACVLAHKNDLSIDCFIYTDSSTTTLREDVLPTFPEFYTHTTTETSVLSFWERIYGVKKRTFTHHEDVILLPELAKNYSQETVTVDDRPYCELGCLNINLLDFVNFFSYRGCSGSFSVVANKSIEEVVQKNILDAPFLKQIDFVPQGVIGFQYTGLYGASLFVDYFSSHKKLFDDFPCQYFGFIRIMGDDECNDDLDEALERLDERYQLFFSDEGYSRIFMTSSKNSLRISGRSLLTLLK